MGTLTNIINDFGESKPLKNLKLGMCLQITKETSVFAICAKMLGAQIAICSANPLSTKDEIASFLDSQGISTYAWSNQTEKEFLWCQKMVLSHRPDIITDDGANLSKLIHSDKKYNSFKILGATEETTTGVTRLSELYNSGLLQYPAISVNNALTKFLFDNRYGTGQSTIDSFLQSANLLMASKRIVVVGYGWVGKGVSIRCKGMGSKVIVTEVDPVKALEAHMDGFEVMPMSQAAKIGNIFITCTGMTSVIRKEHILKMKDGVILCNEGHFDVEINLQDLSELTKRTRTVRKFLDEHLLKNGNRVFLMTNGRVSNLIAAEGNAPEVMAQSFLNQILSILYISKNHSSLPKKVISIPKEIDKKAALATLSFLKIRIDHLTPLQIDYMNSW